MVFVSYLGVLLLVAFLSVLTSIAPLLGEEGVTPVAQRMRALRQTHGTRAPRTECAPNPPTRH